MFTVLCSQKVSLGVVERLFHNHWVVRLFVWGSLPHFLKELEHLKILEKHTIHHGPLTTISEAYNAIAKWIKANGYRIFGPNREVYLREAKPGGSGEAGAVSQNDPDAVTELHFPVEKV